MLRFCCLKTAFQELLPGVISGFVELMGLVALLAIDTGKIDSFPFEEANPGYDN